MATSYLIRAARRARQEAELFAETNDVAAADFLWKEITEAETLLKRATARMRLALRTHSISGYGESHDRMNDSSARLSLAVERLERDDDDPEDDDPEEVADADEDWEAFVSAHPVEPFREREQEREKVALAPFTDDDIIQAVATACRQWDEYAIANHGANRSPGAMTSSIAEVMAGGSFLSDNRVIVRHGDVIRVGQRLGKLMREGRIACLSKSYEHRRYGLAGGCDDA